MYKKAHSPSPQAKKSFGLKQVISICCIFSTLLPAFAYSETLFIEGHLGQSFISDKDYDSSGAQDIALGLQFSQLKVRVGSLKMDDIEYKEVEQSYIDIEGYYLSLSKEFTFNTLSVDIGGGYYDADLEAYFQAQRFTEDSDGSPFLNAKVAANFNDHFAILFDWKYIYDFSGDDINTAQVGLRYSF